ncbi:hypothetical protein MNBD_PLANCTO03-1956, partial [hydrothermal vent metagenome]
MCHSSKPNPTPLIRGSQGRSASEKVYQRCGAWWQRTTRRGLGATLLGVVVMLAGTPSADAQSENPHENPHKNPLGDLLGKPQPLQHRLPTPAEGMAAYETLEGWVRTWDNPGLSSPQSNQERGLSSPHETQKRGLSSPRVPSPAIRVTLYQQGRLIGAATRLAETPGGADLLAATAAEAMHAAART